VIYLEHMIDVCDACWSARLVVQYVQNVVRKIENAPKESNDRPKSDVVIVDCGAIDVEEPFAVAKSPAKE